MDQSESVQRTAVNIMGEIKELVPEPSEEKAKAAETSVIFFNYSFTYFVFRYCQNLQEIMKMCRVTVKRINFLSHAFRALNR